MPKSKGRAGRSSRNFRRRTERAINDSRARRETAAKPQAQPGARNAYQCKVCKGYVVTEHADAGTTPMFLNCRATEGCEGTMVSGMYAPVPAELGEPVLQWYAPDVAEIRTLTPGAREHVNLGGLLLRPVTTESETSHAG